MSPDSSLFRFMPSIAQDGSAEAAVGYSVSNGSTHPGISASWWNLANLSAPVEFSLFPGAADEENKSTWGDYTSMTVDPVDDCTFWYVNEYFSQNQTGTQHNWKTRISNFRLPGCGQTTLSPASGLAFGSVATGTTSASQNRDPDQWAECDAQHQQHRVLRCKRFRLCSDQQLRIEPERRSELLDRRDFHSRCSGITLGNSDCDR